MRGGFLSVLKLSFGFLLVFALTTLVTAIPVVKIGDTATDVVCISGDCISDVEVVDSLTVDWVGLQSYPTTCTAGQYISVLDDTLTCASISITESQVSDLSHTANTNAATICTADDGTTYLDDLGACVDVIEETELDSLAKLNTQLGGISIADGAHDGDTWIANSLDDAGYVSAGTGSNALVWKTDASGNPAWRADVDTTCAGTSTCTNVYSGGGFGSTGCTLDQFGNINCNGDIGLDGSITAVEFWYVSDQTTTFTLNLFNCVHDPNDGTPNIEIKEGHLYNPSVGDTRDYVWCPINKVPQHGTITDIKCEGEGDETADSKRCTFQLKHIKDYDSSSYTEGSANPCSNSYVSYSVSPWDSRFYYLRLEVGGDDSFDVLYGCQIKYKVNRPFD